MASLNHRTSNFIVGQLYKNSINLFENSNRNLPSNLHVLRQTNSSQMLIVMEIIGREGDPTRTNFESDI